MCIKKSIRLTSEHSFVKLLTEISSKEKSCFQITLSMICMKSNSIAHARLGVIQVSLPPICCLSTLTV